MEIKLPRNFVKYMKPRVDEAQEIALQENVLRLRRDLAEQIRWRKRIDPNASFRAGMDCTEWVPEPPSWALAGGKKVEIGGERYKALFMPPEKGPYNSMNCVVLEPSGSLPDFLYAVSNVVRSDLRKYFHR